MIPLVFGIGSAALFLGLSMSVYGAGVLMESTWVVLVFFGLIGLALMVYAINRPLPAWLCRLQERLKLADDLCDAGGACRS